MINKNFNTILELLQAFPDEQICINHLEQLRWNGNVVSPFDSDSKVYKCKGNKYRCKETGKYFNVKTGTLFDNTKVKLQKWFLAIWIVTSHKKGEYVNGRIHTNTIEGFWSLLKRGIFGIYHFTSKKHLQKYVDEFVFRYNSRNSTEANRFNLLLQNTENRLTYKELING